MIGPGAKPDSESDDDNSGRSFEQDVDELFGIPEETPSDDGEDSEK
jgi:hypothetical protein